jgi:16S rRNA G966 N2-methylase RsmD
VNRAILSAEVQQFIDNNLDTPSGTIALKKSPFSDVSSRELAEQIDSKVRTAKKLPLWYRSKGIYYPPKLSIEQASSEATAEYKRSLISSGRLIDLTGGFGVDAFYFSQKADIWHLEVNAELSEISRHNAAILGADNITFVNDDGIRYLSAHPERFDTIYADPSRRIKTQKVFRLADCEPNVISNLPLLLSKSSRIIIKTAPLLDIRSGLSELQYVKEIHVISLKNDCKELLWILEEGYSGDPLIVCAALNGEKQLFKYHLSEESEIKLSGFAAPGRYIYEPDVALLKAGCFKLITKAFSVEKLNANTHLYTSEELVHHFIGRKFELIQAWSYKTFQSKRPVDQASVICRNFPQAPEVVKKKNKIRDGGDTYLLFTTGPDDNLQVLHCKRI